MKNLPFGIVLYCFCILFFSYTLQGMEEDATTGSNIQQGDKSKGNIIVQSEGSTYNADPAEALRIQTEAQNEAARDRARHKEASAALDNFRLISLSALFTTCFVVGCITYADLKRQKPEVTKTVCKCATICCGMYFLKQIIISYINRKKPYLAEEAV